MKTKSMLVVWVLIIITAVYIVGAFIAFLIIPESLYYIFGNLFPFRLPPVWSILSIIAFPTQTVLVTFLIFLDGRHKGNMKRDIILTTIIGLICLVLCCIPEGYGFLKNIVPDTLEKPYSLEFSDDKSRVIVCKRTRSRLGIGNVYLLAPDGRAQPIGEFEIQGGWTEDSDFHCEQYDDYFLVSYRTENGKFEDLVCSFEGLDR